MSSLLGRVHKAIKQRRETRKHEKRERQAIEKEAKQAAHKEYLEFFRKERIATLRTEARARAKREATSKPRLAGLNVSGLGKSAGGFLAKAGKNFLESDQLSLDFDLGLPTAKKKGKRKKKAFNPLEF